MIQQLTNIAMQRLLKSSVNDPAPGGSTSAQSNNTSSMSNIHQSSSSKAHLSASSSRNEKSLKEGFEEQKRNTTFRDLFHIPLSETILFYCQSLSWLDDRPEYVFNGRLFLSESFVCFISTREGDEYSMVIPLYFVKRLEKINNSSNTIASLVGGPSYSIALTAMNNLKIFFKLMEDGRSSDQFLNLLQEGLSRNVSVSHSIKEFIEVLPSEIIFKGDEVVKFGGFGLKYGYPGYENM
jgi:hypothetical protein